MSTQLPLSAAGAGRRKRIKELKRRIHRAERRRRAPVDPYEVYCPFCEAPPGNIIKRGSAISCHPQGGLSYPQGHHHAGRRELARTLQQEILDAGRAAKEELSQLTQR